MHLKHTYNVKKNKKLQLSVEWENRMQITPSLFWGQNAKQFICEKVVLLGSIKMENNKMMKVVSKKIFIFGKNAK